MILSGGSLIVELRFPQCGVHRAGKGVVLLELVLTKKKQQQHQGSKQEGEGGTQFQGFPLYPSLDASSCYSFMARLCL